MDRVIAGQRDDIAGLTLAIDASTYDGSVATFRDGRLASEFTVAMRGEREERLMPAVARCLEAAGAAPRDLRRVVCGAGPGSFTSLRIAASIAKGLAAGLAIPLYAVPSLALSAVDAGSGRWLVTLDAMRGDVFAAGYEWDGTVLQSLDVPTLFAQADALDAARSIGAELIEARPHARATEPLLGAIVANGSVHLATWEPGYGRNAEAQVRWEAAHGRALEA